MYLQRRRKKGQPNKKLGAIEHVHSEKKVINKTLFSNLNTYKPNFNFVYFLGIFMCKTIACYSAINLKLF